MVKFIKDYWDLIGGITTGLFISAIAHFELDKIQLAYSIIILILVSIGVFKIIKQSIDKRKKKHKRKENVIDALVDTQKGVKAVNMATSPTKDGEKLGKLLIDFCKGVKKFMKKIKLWYDKYKGYALSITLGVLSLIEDYGGYINDVFDGKLMFKGYEVLPIITLVAAIIVGILSNGYTKEQREKIKSLFEKSSTNELVLAEIKKNIKENETKLKETNKNLTTKEIALETLKSQLTSAKNTHDAKIAMFNMTPQLATSDDVQAAANEVVNIEAKIVERTADIEKTKVMIKNIETTINALKSQL